MLKLLARLCDRVLVWNARHCEVGRFDGIVLADARNRHDSFAETMPRSLKLVRDHDPRRYARVKLFIHFIVNTVNTAKGGATYSLGKRTCDVEFDDNITGITQELLAALYACVLVHESTHGVIESRGIEYSGDDRRRIERLCVREENRFAAKLVAFDPELYPPSILLRDFNARDWEEHWSMSNLDLALSLWRRSCEDVGAAKDQRTGAD